MATTKVTSISITVLLFLFTTTLSRARDLQNPLPESNSETTTRSHSSSKTQQHDTVSFNLNSIDHVPLTFLDFRPINRHIHPHQRILPLDFPLSHRRCRHGHRRQIPYGNDMILSKDAGNSDRRIQKRLARIHGGGVMHRPMVMTYNDFIRRDEEDRRHHDEKSWFEKKIHELLNLF